MSPSTNLQTCSSNGSTTQFDERETQGYVEGECAGEAKEWMNSIVKWHTTVGVICKVRLLKQEVNEAAGVVF